MFPERAVSYWRAREAGRQCIEHASWGYFFEIFPFQQGKQKFKNHHVIEINVPLIFTFITFIKQFYRPKKFSFKTIICLVDDFMSRSSVFTMIILSSQIRIFQFRYRRHALKNNLAIYNDYRWLLGLILLHHLGMVFVISNTVRYTHFLQFFFKNRAVRTGLGYGKYCLHGSSPFFIKS